ncbi:MAG: hypothetical protein E2601_06310 [Microbacterium sp.]|nr:hypothetical protein [Microbacterium sp.]
MTISLAILFGFVTAWGSYGASMTGDQSWIAMVVLVGVSMLVCLSCMVWAIVQIQRRRTASGVMLAPNIIGLLIITGFGISSGDISNILAWLFPWGYL